MPPYLPGASLAGSPAAPLGLSIVARIVCAVGASSSVVGARVQHLPDYYYYCSTRIAGAGGGGGGVRTLPATQEIRMIHFFSRRGLHPRIAVEGFTVPPTSRRYVRLRAGRETCPLRSLLLTRAFRGWHGYYCCCTIRVRHIASTSFFCFFFTSHRERGRSRFS